MNVFNNNKHIITVNNLQRCDTLYTNLHTITSLRMTFLSNHLKALDFNHVIGSVYE
jgi:hypothetical protein